MSRVRTSFSVSLFVVPLLVACADPTLQPVDEAVVTKARCAAQAVGAVAQCGPPAGYYDAVDPSDPGALRRSLHRIIDDHRRIAYNRRRGTDTWVMLEAADAEPGRPGELRDLYLDRVQRALGGGYGDYDREHAWPKSYGFPDDRAGNMPYTDGHALFIADSGYNRSRGNRPFAWCTAADCEARPTHGGQGTNYIDDARGADGGWEVWHGRRGDVARALFYLDVRYDGSRHGVTGVTEPDLRLTDDRALIADSNTGTNRAVAYMGLRAVLIEWHHLDPPDDRERARNDVVASFQGNRNPFVDHPEWVECVFEDRCGDAPGEGAPWISELHYDNAGADVDEFVEVSGPAGTDLRGWWLLGYNGRDGRVYTAVPLDGVLPRQAGDQGALAFAIAGLQNGGADGVALVDPEGEVAEFWSWEGRLTAADGAAAGLRSDDLGVAEHGDTPVGHSLGRSSPEARWRAGPASPGRPD